MGNATPRSPLIVLYTGVPSPCAAGGTVECHSGESQVIVTCLLLDLDLDTVVAVGAELPSRGVLTIGHDEAHYFLSAVP